METRPEQSASASELYDLACALQQQGKLREAIARFEKVLDLQPQRAGAFSRMGDAFYDLCHLERAEACYRRAIEIEPSFSAAHYNLGTALKDQGKPSEAAVCFRRAIELQPEFAEAWFNLGYALRKLVKLDEAKECFQRALALRPRWAEANVNLGDVLHEQGRFSEAVRCYEEVLQQRPDIAEAHNNLGNAYFEQGRFEEAAAYFRRALAIKADYADAHYNLARTLLLRADFEQGWDEYEWRWKLGRLRARHQQRPRWIGEALHGKTILLHAEQGLGDTIQFIRYASTIKSLGAIVVVECQKPIVPLLRSCTGIDRLCGQGDELPDVDVQVPLLSVPGIRKTSLTTIPAQSPYLFASPELVAAWQQRLSGVSGFRIGVNWHGRAGTIDSHKRDIPVGFFEPLAQIPGVRLVSLQKPDVATDHDSWRLFIANLGRDIDQHHGAFMDTAAIMMHLDLVITSDTSIAHLAGALGVPVWVALPWVPEWRWLLDRDDSPWYPTMRLFRQRTAGNWASVFDALAANLRALTAR